MTLLYILGAGVLACLLAMVIIIVRHRRAARRSAWCRRFSDARFSPTPQQIEASRQHYAEYEAPSYLRVVREPCEMPASLKRQAP